MPCRKYSRAGGGVTPPPALLIFSLVALPPPAPGGGRAPSPLPPSEVARFKSHRQKEEHPQGVLFFLVAEVGFEPHDLRVMSPTSYQAALLRDILVPEAGVEPVRY